MLVLLAGCKPGETERVRVCEQVLWVLETDRPVRLAEPERIDGAADRVRLRYRTGTDGGGGEREIVCRFARWRLTGPAAELEGVSTDRLGELSPITLFLLKTYGLRPQGTGAAAAFTPWAYLLQQLVNAAAPAAVYALLATGYALIYGIIGRINLAYGELMAVGAFAALSGILLGGQLSTALAVAALLGLSLALASGTALGATVAALIFAPLQRRHSQALLIATIGLAVALSELLRLLTDSRQRWLPPLFGEPVLRLHAGDSEIIVSGGQGLLAGLTAAAIGGVLLLMRRSAFGRAYRACADDQGMAALVGVDVSRVVWSVSMLGGALAALAGMIVGVHYGIVSFAMGTLLGFKALTAAVVGGIGSVGGAALGGVLIGVLEGLWAGYLPSAYREVAIFALLALVLTVRPHGLFGQPSAAEELALWRTRPP